MTLDLDETKIKRNVFQLWSEWTLATAGGMLFGFLLSIPLVNLFDLGFSRVLVPLIAGILIGFSQWLVLRRYLTTHSDWILAGGAAWAAGYAFGLLIIQNLSSTAIGEIIAYLLFGAIVGVIQWQMLRREIPSLLAWVAINSLGWAAGLWTSQFVLDLFFNTPVIEPVVSTSVIAGTSGLVAGAITGLALVWIAREPDTVEAM
ncbi:MAG TPA: hypothetical protein VK851_15630 [Anaerolineales bacterium]|nr:hypothetical protein [Anaerolineales bacterium]